jgi:hypothetical protein
LVIHPLTPGAYIDHDNAHQFFKLLVTWLSLDVRQAGLSFHLRSPNVTSAN